MLKLDVGVDNNADLTINGELTEAFRAFVTKGYFSALNGNIEFCEEEQKCKRLIVCGTDKCNTFEPIEWKASLLAQPCPAGKWKNGLGGKFKNHLFQKLYTGSSIYIGPLVQFLKFLSPFQKNFKTNDTSIERTNKGLLHL